MNKLLELLRKIRGDQGQLYGVMTVSVYDVKRGKEERIFRVTKKNQITNAGREIVLALLGQTPSGNVYQQFPDYNNIWSLSVGTDPTPPTLGDTSLGAVVWTSRLDPILTERAVDFANFEINILKTVPAGEATGSAVAEAGIFTKGDDPGSPADPAAANYRRLYARQVHPAITKTATMSITYDWRLGVTIQV